jgi:hypothetical protein
VSVTWSGITNSGKYAQPEIQLNTEKTLLGYGRPKPVEGTSTRRSYDQVPEKVPPIYDGSQLLVFGLFGREVPVPDGVNITAESPDGPLSIRIQVNDYF